MHEHLCLKKNVCCSAGLRVYLQSLGSIIYPTGKMQKKTSFEHALNGGFLQSSEVIREIIFCYLTFWLNKMCF